MPNSVGKKHEKKRRSSGSFRSWTAEDAAAAVAALYQKKVEPHDITRKFKGVSRRHIEELTKMLPPKLVEDENNLQISRWARRVAGATIPNRYWTDHEYREAIFQAASGKMSHKLIEETFGVKKSALKEKVKVLRELHRVGDMSEYALRDAIKGLSLDRAGVKSYLLADENDILVAQSGIAAEHGIGNSRKTLSTIGRDLCHELSRDESLPEAVRKRLSEAKCGRDWLRTSIKAAANRDPALASVFHKPSDKSQRRAEVQPWVATEMFKKMKDMYADLYAKGVLKTPEPEPDQIYTADEVGFDPKGKWRAVHRLQICVRKADRAWRVSTGEKCPFWVSVLFTTRCDGQMPIPPTIVHQGSLLSEFHALHLPTNWVVHTTPSGYMDGHGYLKFARSLLYNCGSRRPLFLFVDGHESHFDHEANNLLLENDVYVFFLAAANSENDQVNDNGPNASLKAIYSNYYEAWLRRNPTVKYNAAFFNSVFASAWQEFQCTCGLTIKRAAERVGLYPLNENAENFQKDQQVSQLYAVPSTSRSSDPSAYGIIPADTSLREARPKIVPEYEIRQARVSVGDRRTEAASIFLRHTATQFFLKSTIEPAREVSKMLEDQKRAKMNKISAAAPDAVDEPRTRLYPTTVSGLQVTADVIEQCRQVEAARKQKNDEAVQRKRKNEETRVDRRRKMEQIASGITRRIQRGDLQLENLGKLPADEIKCALIHFKEAVFNKKAENVEALRASLVKRGISGPQLQAAEPPVTAESPAKAPTQPNLAVPSPHTEASPPLKKATSRDCSVEPKSLFTSK